MIARAEILRRKLGSRPGPSSPSGLFATGGFTSAQITPIVPGRDISAGITVIRATARFEEDQIDRITNGISSGVRDGARTGTLEASEETNRLSERQAILGEQIAS